MAQIKVEHNGETFYVNINPKTNRPYGQATWRQFVNLAVEVYVDRIIQPQIYLFYWLTFIVGIAALAVWGWRGAIELCRMVN